MDPSSVNEQDPSLGWTPLYRCVISANIDAARFLLAQGASSNINNALGESPLH